MFNLLSGLALPVLHKMDAERAHDMTLWALQKRWGPRQSPPIGPQYRIFGKQLPSRIAIAGGVDKNALALPAWRAWGFGFAEIGTVCYSPRQGNAKPRLQRIGGSGLVNYMGLNGDGLTQVRQRLQAFRSSSLGAFCVGVNIASPANSAGELLCLARDFGPLADYLVLNKSCPNVQGHSGAEDLTALYDEVALVGRQAGSTPVMVKWGPTLDDTSLIASSRVCLDAGAVGFICCNTAPQSSQQVLAAADRPRPWPTFGGVTAGGYSGPGLHAVKLHMLQVLRKEFPECVLFGVGGNSRSYKAVDTLKAGADLVQGYTAFAYQGPRLVAEMNKAIAEAGLMKAPSRHAA